MEGVTAMTDVARATFDQRADDIEGYLAELDTRLDAHDKFFKLGAGAGIVLLGMTLLQGKILVGLVNAMKEIAPAVVTLTQMAPVTQSPNVVPKVEHRAGQDKNKDVEVPAPASKGFDPPPQEASRAVRDALANEAPATMLEGEDGDIN